MKKVIYKDGYIYKRYLKHHLLDPTEIIEKRIKLINDFDWEIPGLLNTLITEVENSYIYRQKYCKQQKKQFYEEADFSGLLETLTYFQQIGFVHGDLNKKNIFWTKDGFKVMDYEPSLFQFKNGRKQFMTTKPYFSNKELKKGEVSFLTDKIAFFYFILRINGGFSNRKLIELTRTFNHRSIFGVSEKELNELSYKSILNIAFKGLKILY
tara:strand:- start:1714 stop:2343 length:630 start_codon:yes stop_codon:yes gene_type:complete